MIPEAFKVLLKELQSLALDVKVLTESGEELIIREFEDEEKEEPQQNAAREDTEELDFSLPDEDEEDDSLGSIFDEPGEDEDFNSIDMVGEDEDLDDDMEDIDDAGFSNLFGDDGDDE